MNVPEDLKFAETHEWIRVDGDIGTVGITDHAQAELTDIVFAEAPRKSEQGSRQGIPRPWSSRSRQRAISMHRCPVKS